MAGPKRQPRATRPTTKPSKPSADTSGVSLAQFESISAFAQCVHDLERDGIQGGEQSGTASKKKERADWCDMTNLDAAIQIGLAGGYWQKGADDLQSVEISQGAQDAVVLKPAYELAAVGGCVDVGEYLAGNPECMLGLVDDEQATPVINITYISTVMCGITSRQKLNYGRAILALVESLERQGYSVELTAKLGFTDPDGAGMIGAEADVTVKQAGEQWNASAVAFSIAHPAFSRRLGFRYAEAQPSAEKVTAGGYGQGHGVYPPQDGIFLPYLMDKGAVSTPDAALNYVVELTKQQKPELFA